MGCFNNSCSISGVTIFDNTPAVFIPLIPGTSQVFGKDENDVRRVVGNSNVISPTSLYIYPTDVWKPFALPIYGIANSYGTFETIEKDYNTAAIESYFNIPIEKFFEIVTQDRHWTNSYSEMDWISVQLSLK